MKTSFRKVAPFLAFLGFFNVSILGTLATILTESKSAILDWLCLCLPILRWQSEILLVVVVNIGIVILWGVIQLVWNCLNNGIMRVIMDDDSNGRRIEEFQHLRSQAKKDILIMGIGMTGVSRDTNSIERLLRMGKNVTFLIMNPDILIESSKVTKNDNSGKPLETPQTDDSFEPLQTAQTDGSHEPLQTAQTVGPTESPQIAQTGVLLKASPPLTMLQMQFQKEKIAIDDEKFSKLHSTVDYRKDIKLSIVNLQNFIDLQKKRYNEHSGTWKEGKIKIFKYSYYIPLNVTISDIGEPYSKLIVEFCLPFTKTRIRAKLSRGKVKKLIETQIQELLRNADLISKSDID